jgi:hypothetical protein
MHITKLVTLLTLISLGACQIYYPTPQPDYTIRVMHSNGNYTAIPPTCMNWSTDTINPYDNQRDPQFGCASARNLALMVDKPSDLVNPHATDEGRAVSDVGAIKRYDNNQTRGLIWTGSDPNQAATTTASTPNSAITGDSAGGSKP